MRLAVAVVCCIFAASAFSGTSGPASSGVKTSQRPAKVRKVCYVMTSTSGIPVPCERIFTPIPTTAIALDVIQGGH